MDTQNTGRDRAAAQQRKAAWMQRRNDRINRSKAEAMDRANTMMNNTRHYLPSNLRALRLVELVDMAKDFIGDPDVYGSNGREFRDADKALIRKEVIRRARKRKITLSELHPYEEAFRALRAEADEYRRQQKMTELETYLSNLRNGVAHLVSVAPEVGSEKLSEDEFLEQVASFYIDSFSRSKDYFDVKNWNLDFAKKFVMEVEHHLNETHAGSLNINNGFLDRDAVMDLLAKMVRRAMFGM